MSKNSTLSKKFFFVLLLPIALLFSTSQAEATVDIWYYTLYEPCIENLPNLRISDGVTQYWNISDVPYIENAEYGVFRSTGYVIPPGFSPIRFVCVPDYINPTACWDESYNHVGLYYPANYTNVMEASYQENFPDQWAYRYKACAPPTLQPYMTGGPGADVQASFSGATNKDSYAPGETVQVNLDSRAGYQPNNGFLIGGFVGNIFNGLLCSLFGCSYPPNVAISATFSDAETNFYINRVGRGGATISGNFTAPSTPGQKTISLLGCVDTGTLNGTCQPSAITFTVNSPASVNLNFIQ